MKWQTVDFPNGMNFNVWGPVSVRHNDIYTFYESSINKRIAELQRGRNSQYFIYGDSAYLATPGSHTRSRHQEGGGPRAVLENRRLSSCREVIEWDYGDVGRMWSLVDYKKVLKMRKMQVGKMYLTAIILRNAHVTMNGCNTSATFRLLPPTLEEWRESGPRLLQLN
jgi:hypothetical protein